MIAMYTNVQLWSTATVSIVEIRQILITSSDLDVPVQKK